MRKQICNAWKKILSSNVLRILGLGVKAYKFKHAALAKGSLFLGHTAGDFHSNGKLYLLFGINGNSHMLLLIITVG